LAIEARHRLDGQVEQAVPNYREIDRDPRWHTWLLGIDPLSGKIRQQVLNDAIAAGSAPRVVAFFRGFEQEQGGTGHRAAGRSTARDRSAAQSKPFYTRANIKQNYELHQKGAFWQRGRMESARTRHDCRPARGTHFESGLHHQMTISTASPLPLAP
jgi:hypothetical protein